MARAVTAPKLRSSLPVTKTSVTTVTSYLPGRAGEPVWNLEDCRSTRSGRARPDGVDSRTGVGPGRRRAGGGPAAGSSSRLGRHFRLVISAAPIRPCCTMRADGQGSGPGSDSDGLAGRAGLLCECRASLAFAATVGGGRAGTRKRGGFDPARLAAKGAPTARRTPRPTDRCAGSEAAPGSPPNGRERAPPAPLWAVHGDWTDQPMDGAAGDARNRRGLTAAARVSEQHPPEPPVHPASPAPCCAAGPSCRLRPRPRPRPSGWVSGGRGLSRTRSGLVPAVASDSRPWRPREPVLVRRAGAAAALCSGV